MATDSEPLPPQLAANRDNWNARVPIHLGPGGYQVERLDDPAHITDVVAFDAERLGELVGRRVVHLQCHIGSDTVSLARLGAAEVVGIDFSPPAIEAATALAERCGAPARFVLSDVYRAAQALAPERFDVAYTSVGTICWLDDIDRWAATIAALLVPGGRFVFRDLHPTMWPYEEIDGTIVAHYPYWQRPEEPLVLDNAESYLGEGTIASPRTNEWNHTVAEVLNALIGAGLRIDHVDEHRECDWRLFPSAVEDGPHWLLPEPLRDKLPVCWSIVATRS